VITNIAIFYFFPFSLLAIENLQDHFFLEILEILIPLFGKIMANVHFIISQPTLKEPTL
jgi:hypothetical protein